MSAPTDAPTGAPTGALTGALTGGLARTRDRLADDGWRLERAWPRDPGHLLLHVTGRGEGWTAGQWFDDDQRAARLARRTAGAVHLPGSGVVLQPRGADDRLPGLARLLRRPGAELVAHRPGRRAVVRLDQPGGAPQWAKAVRPGRGAALGRTASWQPDGVRVPRLLHHDEAAGVVVTESLPGLPLLELASRADEVVLRRAWRGTGALLARVHATAAPDGAPEHPLAAEVAVATRWLHLARAHGALPERVVDDLERAVAAHAADVSRDPRGPAAPVTLHRDLHDKQVLVDVRGVPAGAPPRLGVLDLDLVAHGDAALDLGNLLAHAALRRLQREDPAPAGALDAAVLHGYRAAAGRLPALRTLCAYVGLAAARLAAVYSFRAGPAPVRGPGASRPVATGGDTGGDRVVAGLVALAHGGPAHLC